MSLSGRSQGLYLPKKLCKEQIHLTSYSRMRVDLPVEVMFTSTNLYVSMAIQVLSASVAKAFDYYGDWETQETQRFVATFDKFFDCLNVRSPQEHIKRLKPNLKPYETIDDMTQRLSITTCIFPLSGLKGSFCSIWLNGNVQLLTGKVSHGLKRP